MSWPRISKILFGYIGNNSLPKAFECNKICHNHYPTWPGFAIYDGLHYCFCEKERSHTQIQTEDVELLTVRIIQRTVTM